MLSKNQQKFLKNYKTDKYDSSDGLMRKSKFDLIKKAKKYSSMIFSDTGIQLLNLIYYQDISTEIMEKLMNFYLYGGTNKQANERMKWFREYKTKEDEKFFAHVHEEIFNYPKKPEIKIDRRKVRWKNKFDNISAKTIRNAEKFFLESLKTDFWTFVDMIPEESDRKNNNYYWYRDLLYIKMKENKQERIFSSAIEKFVTLEKYGLFYLNYKIWKKQKKDITKYRYKIGVYRKKLSDTKLLICGSTVDTDTYSDELEFFKNNHFGKNIWFGY